MGNLFIKHEENGEVITKRVKNIGLRIGDRIKKAKQVFVRPGADVFNEWSKNPTQFVADHPDNNPENNLTFFDWKPVWDIPVYYHFHDGSVETAYYKPFKPIGELLSAPNITETIQGEQVERTFFGWGLSSSALDSIDETYVVTDALHLYALYDYVVSFKESGTLIENRVVLRNTLLGDTPEILLDNFQGVWKDENDNMWTASSTVQRDAVLVPWTSIDIVFDLNGEGVIANQTPFYVTTLKDTDTYASLAAAAPKVDKTSTTANETFDFYHTGKEFLGWYTSKNGGTKLENYKNYDGTTTATKNKTYYAHWGDNIKFDSASITLLGNFKYKLYSTYPTLWEDFVQKDLTANLRVGYEDDTGTFRYLMTAGIGDFTTSDNSYRTFENLLDMKDSTSPFYYRSERIRTKDLIYYAFAKPYRLINGVKYYANFESTQYLSRRTQAKIYMQADNTALSGYLTIQPDSFAWGDNTLDYVDFEKSELNFIGGNMFLSYPSQEVTTVNDSNFYLGTYNHGWNGQRQTSDTSTAGTGNTELYLNFANVWHKGIYIKYLTGSHTYLYWNRFYDVSNDSVYPYSYKIKGITSNNKVVELGTVLDSTYNATTGYLHFYSSDLPNYTKIMIVPYSEDEEYYTEYSYTPVESNAWNFSVSHIPDGSDNKLIWTTAKFNIDSSITAASYEIKGTKHDGSTVVISRGAESVYYDISTDRNILTIPNPELYTSIEVTAYDSAKDFYNSKEVTLTYYTISYRNVGNLGSMSADTVLVNTAYTIKEPSIDYYSGADGTYELSYWRLNNTSGNDYKYERNSIWTVTADCYFYAYYDYFYDSITGVVIQPSTNKVSNSLVYETKNSSNRAHHYALTFYDSSGTEQATYTTANAVFVISSWKTAITNSSYRYSSLRITAFNTDETKFRTNTYTLDWIKHTFQPNSGLINGSSNNVIYYYLSGDYYYDLPTVTRDGYSFTKWQSTVYPNETIENGASVVYLPTSHSTIKAMWEQNAFTITFDGDGGTTPSSITGSTITLPNSTRSSVVAGNFTSTYTFNGWKNSSGTIVGTYGDSYTPTTSETLTADWSENISVAAVSKDNLYVMKAIRLSSNTVPSDTSDAAYQTFLWGTISNPNNRNYQCTIEMNTTATSNGAVISTTTSSTDNFSVILNNTFSGDSIYYIRVLLTDMTTGSYTYSNWFSCSASSNQITNAAQEEATRDIIQIYAPYEISVNDKVVSFNMRNPLLKTLNVRAYKGNTTSTINSSYYVTAKDVSSNTSFSDSLLNLTATYSNTNNMDYLWFRIYTDDGYYYWTQYFKTPVPAQVYGYRVKISKLDPSTRVEYIKPLNNKQTEDDNNVQVMDWTPVSYSGTTFSYGSWEDSFIVQKNKPVFMNTDGSIYALAKSGDLTRTEDGTQLTVTQQQQLNTMASIPKAYVWRFKTSTYRYCFITEEKPSYDINNRYKCLAHQYDDDSSHVTDYVFMGVWPSVYGDPNGNYSTAASHSSQLVTGYSAYQFGSSSTAMSMNDERYSATQIGDGWNISDWSTHQLINDFLTLLGKSTDIQTVFDANLSTSNVLPNWKASASYRTNAYKTVDSSHAGEQFCTNDYSCATLYLYALWGAKILVNGITTSNSCYNIKMHPPYDYSSTTTVPSDWTSIAANTSTAYITDGSYNEYGFVPTTTGSTSGVYETDYTNTSYTGTAPYCVAIGNTVASTTNTAIAVQRNGPFSLYTTYATNKSYSQTNSKFLYGVSHLMYKGAEPSNSNWDLI